MSDSEFLIVAVLTITLSTLFVMAIFACFRWLCGILRRQDEEARGRREAKKLQREER